MHWSGWRVTSDPKLHSTAFFFIVWHLFTTRIKREGSTSTITHCVKTEESARRPAGSSCIHVITDLTISLRNHGSISRCIATRLATYYPSQLAAMYRSAAITPIPCEGCHRKLRGVSRNRQYRSHYLHVLPNAGGLFFITKTWIRNGIFYGWKINSSGAFLFHLRKETNRKAEETYILW